MKYSLLKLRLCLTGIAILICTSLALAQNKEPYVRITGSDNAKTLTFYYGEKPEDALPVQESYTWFNRPTWTSEPNIQEAVFDPSFADYLPTSTSCWFYNMSSLKDIEGLENLNTSNVTNMGSMFFRCSCLISLDLSNFDTNNVADMVQMFYGCSDLTSLDVSNFNTINVTNMGQMFDGCSGLTSLDLSNFNTNNVTSMGGMFRWSGLTSLNLSNFNTSNVTYMSEMFRGCHNLTNLDLSNFNTSNVTSMSNMFDDCSGLTNLDVSNFDTSNVTNMRYMFDGCSGLTAIYVGEGWNTDAVESGDHMFSGCSNLFGEKGTAYNYNSTDVSYAHIDGGADNPGYFTTPGTLPLLPYAVLTGDDDTKTLTFYFGEMPADAIRLYGFYNWSNLPMWCNDANIQEVVFDPSFADYMPTSTSYWFNNMSSLKDIEGLENLNTSYVTDMSYMFQGCSSLTSLDLSNFNTSNVTNMSGMFYGCSGLTNLDLSNFDTSKVTFMPGMFGGCSGLTNLDVSNFDIGNVTQLYSLFYGCSSLTNLNLSNLNTSNVTDMSYMFRDCLGLTSLDVSHFNTSNVTSMSEMFRGCSGFTSLDVSHFDTSNVTSMSEMFYGCSGLTSLDVSNFNTSKVTDMGWMFYRCSSLTSLDVSNFDIRNVSDMYSMFSGCSGLTSLDVSHFDTSNVTNMSNMFSGCSGLTNLDVSNFDTNNVTDMGYMFSGCSGLTSLNVSNFSTDNVTKMNYLFSGCSGLTSLDVSNFDTSKVTDMGCMFKNCSGLTSLNVSNFDTSNVTDMGGMFRGCSGFTSLDLSNFDTGKVTSLVSWSGDGMFYGCSSMKTIYVGEAWSTDALRSSGNFQCFYGCTNLFGGKGTAYKVGKTDESYAHIDGGTDNPGYFTTPGTVLLLPYVLIAGDDDAKTLTFYYGEMPTDAIRLVDSYSNWGNLPNWCNDANIQKVVFDHSFADYLPTSTSYWFYNMSSLKDIEGLGNLNTSKVTNMSYMFSGCSGLISLDLSNFNTSNVTSMSYMFNSCSGLTAIYVGDGWNTDAVEYGDYMFSGCSNLFGEKGTTYNYNYTGVSYAHIDGGTDNPGYFTTPGTVPLLPYALLTGDDAAKTLTFYYGEMPTGAIRLVGSYNWGNRPMWCNDGNIQQVVFDPSFTDYLPNSTSCWFYNMSSLKDIEGLENLNTSNVTDMSYMFQGCSSLTSLDVSNFNTSNVTGMNEMFYDCSSLTSLDLSNFDTGNVTNMNEMFRYCSGLTSIYVGDGWNTDAVEYGNYMFSGCSNLFGEKGTTYNFRYTSVSYAHIDGGTDNPGYFTTPGTVPLLPYALLNDDDAAKTLTFYYGEMPTGAIRLNGPYDYYNLPMWCNDGNIQKVVFDPSFANYLPTSTSCWFYNMSSLKAIEGLENLNTSNVTDMSHMFQRCQGLTSLNVSHFSTINVTDMSGMFSGCSSLTSINIPDVITSIGDEAFEGCSSLTSITIPDGVKSIGSNAFFSCSSLTSINIPEGVMSIGESAFTSCFSLASINIPEGVTSIGDGAFSHCSSLASITVDRNNPKYDSRNDCNAIIETATNTLIAGCMKTIIPNNICNIGDFAFDGCHNLTSITIPDGVSSIGNGTFSYCSSLTSINIPDGVTSIGNSAFERCPSLISINIPDGVTSIGKWTFCACSSLTSISIPDGVTSIGYGAFSGCSSLTSINIPDGVTSIGYYAFSGCSSLEDVYCYAESVPTGTDVFLYAYDYISNATLHVPASALEDYKNAEQWKDFGKIVPLDIEPMTGNEGVDFADNAGIDEGTALDGNIVGNLYYNISNGDGAFDASENCIVINKSTSEADMADIEDKEFFDPTLREQFTGLIFKVPTGSGKIKVTAETTGNFLLKVKIGKNDPIEIELEGKMKFTFPYNVEAESYVYIYAGESATDVKANGARRTTGSGGSLKIYGIETEHNSDMPTDITDVETVKLNDEQYFDLDGRRLTSKRSGVNIVRGADGSIKKVAVN